MKKLMMFAIAAALVCSCNKEEMSVEPGKESTLYVSLVPDDATKASGSAHGVQAEDNHIQTLEIFVFRVNEGKADDGMLDGYRKFTESELGNLKNLELQTTTGDKVIYVVANSHKENWHGINTRELFEEQTARLVDEDVKNFIMVGVVETPLLAVSSITLSVKRMIARVKLNSLKTEFAGGPYDGMSLTDVKAYLVNVHAGKMIYDGSADNSALLNKGEYVEADVNSCKMEGMLYDNLAAAVNDEGYSVPHYFYCYENPLSVETDDEKFTRIIIEGKMNGTTYYYPVILRGVARNCCYSLDITIKRPGSLEPGKDVPKSVLMTSLTVENWKVQEDNKVEF